MWLELYVRQEDFDMNSRERLAATLEHRQPDRVCVDFGVGADNMCDGNENTFWHSVLSARARIDRNFPQLRVTWS